MSEVEMLKAQLAEAVGLLRQIDGGEPLLDCSTAKALEVFLARHAQAEQQEGQPQFPLRNPRSAKFQAALEETFQKFEAMSDEELEAVVAAHMPQHDAQGAQAGDELAAFKKWFAETGLAESWGESPERVLENAGNPYASCCVGSRWHAWKARATQPAVGEPVAWVPTAWLPIEQAPLDNKRPLYIAQFSATGELIELDWNAVWEAESESWEMPQIYYIWTSANGRVEEPTHFAYMDAQPAALGDEAVRKDAERYRWLRDNGSGNVEEPDLEGCLVLCTSDGTALDSAIDAAMRAQEEK